jgi:hypothetical protein
MRKFYTLAFFATMLISFGCSKDVLKSYDRRIQGTWEIIDRDRFGFNEPDALPFDEGDRFTFGEDGALTIEREGNTYSGSWDIQRIRTGDDNNAKTLQITAVDFTNQQVRSERFNDMIFTNTNRFTAIINYNTRAYVYRFLRQ